jgi:BASS family bile acid:Na+ symporter
MTLGYVLARVFKQDPNRSRTIAMETGIQNGPMAILIVTLSITGAIQQDVLLIPVLYSLFIVVSSSIVAFFFRKLSTKESLARDQRKLGSMMSAR